MAQVFISYSRKDKDFVRRLQDALAAQKREAWVDWKDIPLTAEWEREILANIEAADNFVFVISPDSVASPNCQKEIDHAAANNKRMAPIFYRFVPDDEVPDVVGKYQRIEFFDEIDFSSKFEMLVKALDTDLAWTQSHTRLLTRAKEWEREGEDSSFLLRGKDLDEAERWVARSAEREPKPTGLQTRYIVASRQASTRRQRIVVGAVVTALMVALGLAAYAFRQRGVANENAVKARQEEAIAVENEKQAKFQQNVAEQQTQLADQRRVEAERQTKIALSRALGAAAQLKQDSELDLASLLGLEALKVADTFEARNAVVSMFQANPRLLTYLHHPAFVTKVAFSGDGKSLATLDENGIARLWDMATRRVVWQDKGSVNNLAFSPRRTLLALASRDGSVRLWDTATRVQVHTIKARRGLNGLAFSSDGRLVAFASSDGFVEVWNALSLERDGGAVQVSEHGVWGIAFSPDAKFLATCGSDGPLLLDLVSKKVQKAKKTFIGDLAFSADGKVLAASSPSAGVIQVWEVPSLNSMKAAEVPTGREGAALAYSTDGKLLALGLGSGRVQLFDGTDRTPMPDALQAHRGAVTSVASSPDGKMLATSARDRTVLIWNVTTPRMIAKQLQEYFPARVAAPQALAFSSDGRTLASAGFDSTLRFWDIASQAQIGDAFPLDSKKRTVGGDYGPFAFSADMRLLASAKADGVVELWNLATKKPAPERSISLPAPPRALAFSPDRKLLASAFSKDRLQVWNVQTGKPGRVLVSSKDQTEIRSVAFSRDGKLLAAADQNGNAQLWDVEHERRVGGVLESGTLVGSNLVVSEQLSNVAFSPDRQIVATGSKDGSVRFWNVATRKLMGEPLIDELGKEIISVVFSPDGKLFATGGEDAVRLWDVATRQALGKPLQTLAHVVSMGISPDGNVLVWSSRGGYLWISNVSQDVWTARVCLLANRNLSLSEWEHYVGASIPYHRTCPNLPPGSGGTGGQD